VGLIPENELSIKAGIAISPKTRGAEVDETRQTSVPGIFACGNVLQVHDLVDFVSEEAFIAGRAAARYAAGGAVKGDYVRVCPAEKVSYVVPQRINRNTGESVKLFFRPAGRFQNIIIEVSDAEKVIASKKKIAVAPGEMETLVLTPGQISSAAGEIKVGIKE
jgi:hypothetical protein